MCIVSVHRYKAVAVRQLAEVVERVAPKDPVAWEDRKPIAGTLGLPTKVSRARARQLWMVVAMWDRALEHSEFPARARRSAAELFTARALRRFWELAQTGELRTLAPEAGRDPVLPLATLRIVRDCLKILAPLAAPARREVWLPSVQQPELKTPVRTEPLATLYRRLADLAAKGPLERDGIRLSYEDRARLLAMVAILLHAAPRSGELAALRLSDLAPEERAVAVRRRQQKASPNRAEEIAEVAGVSPSTVRSVLWGQHRRVSEATYRRIVSARDALAPLPEVEWYAMGEGAWVAVRQWLTVRKALIESSSLEGGEPGLWVTLVPTKAGPPGITLRAQGLTQAFARGMRALNWVMAGQRGWEPMPVRMEQVRRAISVEPMAGSVGSGK